MGFGPGEDRFLMVNSLESGKGGTERVWAFREEESRADIAVAKDAGSLLDCFFRSRLLDCP